MFDKKTRCCNGGNQHKFEPRYSEEDRGIAVEVERGTLKDLRDFATLKVYVKDICTWCGKTIEK
jgi:hypothetical protein